MVTNNAHQDASKDPVAVRSALATMRRQYIDILRHCGANPVACKDLADVIESATEFMLSEVEPRND